MIDPAIVKKLISDVPELKKFIVYLNSEANSLNNLSDIKLTDPNEIAVELLARQRAYEVITKILDPLIFPQNFDTIKKDEYIT